MTHERPSVADSRWFARAAVTGLTVLLAGLSCGSGQQLSAVQPQPTPAILTPKTWSVSFSVSGGFAGLVRDLEISSTGQATAADRRTGTEVTLRVPDAELAEIGAAVAAVAAAKPTRATRGSSCRDCFAYHVEIRADSQRLSADLDDLTLEASDLRPLIAALKRVLDRTLTENQQR